MQEMKYFNEGNDCDICKNQFMTGRDGTVEDCRRRQNGLSCRFEERDIRTCPVCEHEVDREDMYFTKFDYYMAAYDDDLILVAAKGKKDIRITGAAAGASFEDIQSQLIDEKASSGWKEQIADAVDRVVDKMLKETPPETEEERQNCETMRETIKGMFLTQRRSKAEAIDGTGWKVIRCDVSKKRTIRIEQNCSAWDVAQQAITTYRCEMVFDSLNKGISVYEKYGEDRGAYFIERLNLKRLQVQSNSYDFATRLIPIGKDGLMLNIDGKNYVENHQYSKKVKTMTWKDERYTDAESLKEDAEAKLDELSKPYRSYTAEIINLVEAVQDEEKKEQYKEVFSIALGDTVLLISKSTGIRESHRIVKFYEYPLTKEKNKVELANTRLSFEEVQRTEQELS